MKMRNERLLNGQYVERLDMQTVAALAKAVSEGFQPTGRRDRAELEYVSSLITMDLLISDATRVPLRYTCRRNPPPLRFAIEPRGACPGVCIELTVDVFTRLVEGDFEARLLSRFGFAKIAQIGSKYGFVQSDAEVMREFANLDQYENSEAMWGAAFSLVTPEELYRLGRGEGGVPDVNSVAQTAMIPVDEAALIVGTFDLYRDALLHPRFPRHWREVKFVKNETPSRRRRK